MVDVTGSIDEFLSGLTKKPEVKVAKKKPTEITKHKKKAKKKHKAKKFTVLQTRVSKFDQLLADRGMERGSTVLISGGTGTGKTTFCIESLYNGALNGEKGLFISFEEEPEKIKLHMQKNFGWRFGELEKRGLIAFVKYDAAEIARTVEALFEQRAGTLRLKIREMRFPIKPDRIVVDSLSALSIAFQNEENYRRYIRELFELLEEYNSVNLVITETTQNPKIYSRTGVEEFLADSVVVLYSQKIGGKRQNSMEILKIRSGRHVKEMVPYRIDSSGVVIDYKGK